MDTITPPTDAPKYIVEGLPKQNIETLEELAAYCEKLAEQKRVELESDMDGDPVDTNDPPDEWEKGAEKWESAVEDIEAPAKAHHTVKEIYGNRYHYLQWREGSKIKSEYVAPVNPSE